MKSKFLVTGVLTQGFNDQQVSLENESACITIRLKDQADFNKFSKGQELEVSVGKKASETKEAPKAKKPATKKA